MLVRIRLESGPRVQQDRDLKLRLAVTVAGLLTPAAVMAGALAVWGIAAGRKWTGDFPISNGFLASWPTWVIAAVILQLLANALNRYARRRYRVRRGT